MKIFTYGEKELDYLKKKDQKLKAAIERIGMIEREVTPDLFVSLINSIVGQQISSKAAETVWGRIKEKLGDITPETIVMTTVEDIQSCGMSMRKANYIKGIGSAVYHKELMINEFPSLSDDEIIKKLSALHGVGMWTAEMLLIFSMERPNIVSWGDLAIRRGIINLYGLNDLTKEQFNKYKKRYSPYGSVASLYLWALSVND